MSKTASPQAIEVLKNAQIDGSYVRLTGQIDRKLYLEVNEVLSRLGGVWKSGKTKAHVFPEDKDPALLIDSVVSNGMMPGMPDKNPLAFFPTPSSVVMLILEKAKQSLFDGSLVLEPSAGDGAIAQLVQQYFPKVNLDLIEKDPGRCEVLLKKGFCAFKADFLQVEIKPIYDCVLMNPPFALKDDPKAYITHIAHAWGCLKPGGWLIAIAPNGFSFASDVKSKEFKSFIEANGQWEELPDGAFRPHTGVRTVLISLLK